jgi:replicative DNA helicase
MSSADGVERLPPQNKEAERSVLGSMLRDNTVISSVVQIVRADDFYADAHQKIFDAIVALNDRGGQPVDVVLLAEELHRRGQIDDIGRYPYLNELWDAAPTAANAEYYGRIVRDKAIIRNLIHASTEILRDAYDQAQPADELLGDAERRIMHIAQMGISGQTITLEEAIVQTYIRLDKMATGEQKSSGLATGFLDLDEITAGLHDSELIIIAARPSVGKCLPHDAEVVLADGSVQTMGEIYHRRQTRLLTLQPSWRLHWTEPSAYVDDGIKPVFRVTTRLGRTVETTLSHPFLTVSGWRPLADLEVGEAIAVPRVMPVFGNEQLRECEIKILAYLLGDGCLTDITPEFTNSNPRLQADFAEAVSQFGGMRGRCLGRASEPGTECSGGSVGALRPRAMPGAIKFRPVGACGEAESFGRRADCVTQSASLKHPEAPDGARFDSPGHRPGGKAPLAPNATPPLTALEDSLRARLGRHSTIVRTHVKRGRSPLTLWLQQLGVWGKDAHTRSIPPIVFRLRRPLLALFLNRLFTTDGWVTVLAEGRAQLGYATVSERLARQVQHLLLRFGIIATVRRRAVSCRHRAWQVDITDQQAIRTFSEEIGIFGKEEALLHTCRTAASRRSHPAHSDIYWDRIVAIEPVGRKQVYDLTIPETHNFVANDVCVHNTAFSLNLVRNIITDQKEAVFFVSLEQSATELAERLLCSQAQVDSHRLRKGTLSAEDMDKLMAAGTVLSSARLFIDDAPFQGMLRIAANARRLKMRHNIKLVVIDYLQLIEPDNRRDPRQEQVAQISRRLKALAKELQMPVIALAQVNRASEDRQDHRPRLADLRESGSIEQDADTVMLLHRPDRYEPGQHEGIIEVIIGKQRNGPTGEVTLAYLKQFMRYENYAAGTPFDG